MRERTPSGFFGRIGLLIPAVAAPMAEAGLLRAFDPGSAGMAAQVTAPAPLDLFHDMRWISVFHDSWVVFGLEIMAVLVLRILWAVWPVALLAAGAAGLLNARAVYGVVQDIAVGRKRRPLRALTPALVAAVFGVTVGGSAIGFALTVGQHHEPRHLGPLPAAAPGDHPVLIAAGLHSHY